MLARGGSAGRVALFVLVILLTLPLRSVTGGSARLAPPHEDAGVDMDGDGRFDVLRVGVNVAVSTPGMFVVEIRLFDGTNLTQLDYRYLYRLLAGTMTVSLDFDGIDLWRSGVDGPYVVNVWLYDDHYVPLDFGQHVTLAYLHTDFERPALWLAPPHSDAGMDTDGDGLFDFLQYRVNVEVQDPGPFRIEGWIRDAQYAAIASDSAVLTLTTGPHSVPLNFSGWRLRNFGDGPYTVVIWAYADFAYSLDSGTYTTSPYSSTQFDTSPGAFVPPHADTGIDADGDGFFDVLRISANVSLDQPGRYWVTARLFDPAGGWVWDMTSDQTELAPGSHTFTVDFDGDRIRRNGLSGSFRADLSLWTDYGSVPVATGVHLTRPYANADFAPALLSFSGGLSDQGVDADGNGLFDGLAVDGTLSVTRSGFYRLGGVLRASWTDLDSAMVGRWMNPGPTSFQLVFDGGNIRRFSADGPYTVYLYLLGPGDAMLGDSTFMTRPYLSTDFEPLPITYAPPHGTVSIDTDGDGLYDVLRTNVNVTVTRNGTYSVTGNLFPTNGTGGYASASATAFLEPGNRTFDLDFAGWQVRAMGSVGEHRISLGLFAGPVYMGWDYLRTNLTAADFEPGSVRFLQPHRDSVVDADGDGTFDTLRVDVGLEVDVAGTYLVDANAVDSDGAMFPSTTVDSSAFHDLRAGPSTVSLDFPGWRLVRSVDGPFLIEMRVYDASGEELARDEHITAPYRIADFAHPAVIFTPPHSDAALDTDGDGLYDRLVVDMSVNISVAGTYTLSAHLVAPTVFGGLDSVYEEVFLPPGAQTVRLNFSTASVALSGVAGPYRVDAYLGGASGTHTTAPYPLDVFDAPTLRFETPIADSAEDRDVPPDGVPDILRVDIRVNASDAGNLLIYAGLWDAAEAVLIDAQQRWASVGAGVSVVPVSFPGPFIRDSGIDGPYVVKLVALGDGRGMRPWVQAEHLTAAYRAEDFAPFAPAVLRGFVRVSSSGDGVFKPYVSAFSYRDGISVEGFSEASGAYDLGLYEGDWLVTVDDTYYSTASSRLQAEAAFVRVRGTVTTADFDLVPSTGSPSVVDLSFQDWGHASFRRVETGAVDNRTVRQRIDWYYGNRDGYLTLPEFDLSIARDLPVRVPAQSHELFRVDDSVYGLVPGSESLRRTGAEGPVSDSVPIQTELAGSFTPARTIAPASRHEIAVRVEYDAFGVDRAYRVSLPPGYDLVSYNATSLVRVKVTGPVVVLDPGPDVPLWRDVELPPVLHEEWVRLVVANPDAAPPTIVSAFAAPDPVEVGEPLAITARVVDDVQVEAVTVEVVDPGGATAGNFTMTASGDSFSATLIPGRAGGYTFRVWAFDAVGGLATREGRFWAIDSRPPVFLNAGAAPDPAEIGLPVSISADVSDVDGVALVLVQVWTPAGGVVGTFFMAGSGGRFTHAFTPADPGVYTMVFTATDLAGNAATTTGSFAAVDTTPPVAAAGVDRSVDLGTEVMFDGTASADNHMIALYAWTFTDEGRPIFLTGAMAAYAFTSPGARVVTLTVTDPSGNQGSDTVVITVVRPFGEIRGTVRAPSGPVAGAIARLFDNGVERTAVPSDGNGVFHFSAVTPGSYTIRVEAPGYLAATIAVVVVEGQTTFVSVFLARSGGEDGPLLASIAVAGGAVGVALGYLMARRRQRPPKSSEGFPAAVPVENVVDPLVKGGDDPLGPRGS